MKKIFYCFFLLSGLTFQLSAQEKGIKFLESQEWNQAVKKAKKEKRLIFVDCYTKTCGPCKMLAANVFPIDSVGEFFNKHFVNVKMDMEEGDGGLITREYGVMAYPTLLFIDPVTQKEQHRGLGQLSAGALLKEARIALDPENNLAGMTRRYEAGERDPEFLIRFLEALAKTDNLKKSEITVEYLNTLDLDQLLSEDNWKLLVGNISDPLAKPLRLVVANKGRFYDIAAENEVNYKINSAIRNAVDDIVAWTPAKGAFDETRNAELVRYLETIDEPTVSQALAKLYAAAYVRKADYWGLMQSIQEVLKYRILPKDEEQKYFNTFIESFKNCQDKALVSEAIQLLDKKCEATSTFYGKADLMKQKALLQESLGDTAGAEQSKAQEDKFRTQGDDAGEWML